MDKDKMLCPCKKVTKGVVLKAMKKGAHTFKAVEKETGAGSKCGKCEKDIKKFIKKHLEDVE